MVTAASITNVSPTTGPMIGRTSVVLTGEDLKVVTGILFGSTPASSFTINSDTQITAISPAGSNGSSAEINYVVNTTTVDSGFAFTYCLSTILTQVSVGSSANAWGVDAAYNIYQFQSSDDWTTCTQTQIPGGLKQVSVGADGTVWGVGPSGNIERYNGNNSWTQIPGGLAQISVGSASHIWGVNAAGNIERYNGSGWTQIPGGLKQVSVAADGTVWGVNAQGLIYQYNGSGWTMMPGHGPNGTAANGNGTFMLVAVGSASTVYALDPSDPNINLYQYTGNPEPYAWNPVVKSTMTFFSVASDRSQATINQGITTIQGVTL